VFERVHCRSALLIDTHNDITSRTVDGYDIGKARTTATPTSRRSRKAASARSSSPSMFRPATSKDNRSAHRTLEMIDTVRHDIVERYPNDFALATTADDIERIHKQARSPR
jgi:membrane dipeptidase